MSDARDRLIEAGKSWLLYENLNHYAADDEAEYDADGLLDTFLAHPQDLFALLADGGHLTAEWKISNPATGWTYDPGGPPADYWYDDSDSVIESRFVSAWVPLPDNREGRE